jgi:hypothetical protein
LPCAAALAIIGGRWAASGTAANRSTDLIDENT